jgi:hypothetical protein
LCVGAQQGDIMDYTHHEEIKMGSERSFGLVFFAFFILVAAFPLLSGEAPRLWAIAIALVFAVLAFLKPSLLAPLNRLWFRFGLLLGRIVAPIVLTLVFLLTVVPTGLVMRALGKDPMRRTIGRSIPSYWIERELPVGSMRNQF